VTTTAGSLSGASTIPKDDEEAAALNQNKNTKLDRALTVIKKFCAIGRESKLAEDGRQALEHTRAVRMAIFNVGERDISNVRVILASFGIFAIDMADIDAMGIHDPQRPPYQGGHNGRELGHGTFCGVLSAVRLGLRLPPH
jgi:hypothetical protein